MLVPSDKSYNEGKDQKAEQYLKVKMSIPALRQPKAVKQPTKSTKNTFTFPKTIDTFVILTLKDGGKLVISSDAYNGILTLEDGFKCVLCCAKIKLDAKCKEDHKMLPSHKRILEQYPHKEEHGSNLIRQLNKELYYCTICNATMPVHILMYHMAGEAHLTEIEKASVRAGSYLPNNNNK